METDKQVYAPGEILHAVFSGDSGHTGQLTVSAFEETYTLEFSTTAAASIQVPTGALAGTTGIAWTLTPTDPAKPQLSGTHPIDISGLSVKVAKATLEKGQYAPGETINAHYIFETNQDHTLALRSWIVTPSGDWTYQGETTVTVTAARQQDALTANTFTTAAAGTHELVYGLYRTEDNSNNYGGQLVVSGRTSFDVGEAVLLGIQPSQNEYRNGNEPVPLKIDYMGRGSAQLKILLDEETVHQQSLTLDGGGSGEVVLESGRISGGPHTVKAILAQNNLTSTKTTAFTYGANLPDLTPRHTETQQDGLNYTIKIEVANQGKTTAAATTLTMSDNGLNVTTASIPSLPPAQTHEITFNWNAAAKAGTHELIFTADANNTVKELSETNNTTEITLEIPTLYYTLNTDPENKWTYPAKTPVNLITRLINNQETPILITLELVNHQ